jgi:hypothetical protein
MPGQVKILFPIIIRCDIKPNIEDNQIGNFGKSETHFDKNKRMKMPDSVGLLYCRKSG